MQKAFCDICEEEIKPDAYSGGMMRSKDIHRIVPMPSPDLKGSREGGVIQKKVVQEVWDLCEECQKWIWEQAEGRIKEFKRKEELLKSSKPG